MKIKIDNHEISISNLGHSTEKHGTYTRLVTFEMNGKQFDLTIILTPNGTGKDYEDFNNFYAMNKDAVDAGLREYISHQNKAEI